MLRFCIALTATCAALAQAADPPRPDVQKPVNYVRWINEEYGRGIAENAADRYLQAISAFAKDDDTAKIIDEPDAAKWTPDQRRKVKTWIQKNGTCIDHFTAAARISDCYFTLKSESGEMAAVMLPEVGTMRSIAKLLAARARLRLLDGDTDGAVEDVSTVLAVGRHLQNQSFVIQYLVGISIAHTGYVVLLDLPKLASGTPDYEKIISKLRLMNRDPEPPNRALETERLAAFDLAQRCAKDTNGDGRFDVLALPKEVGEVGKSSDTKLPLSPPVTFDAMTKQISDFFDQLRTAVAGDYQKGRTLNQRLQKDAAANGQSVIAIVGPAQYHVIELYYKSLAERNGAQVVLELHAYRAKNGKWPATLDEGLMPSIARPRLDPFSGQPLLYQLKNGQPLLYSVGENAADDHGEVFLKDGRPAAGATGDYVFWPR